MDTPDVDLYVRCRDVVDVLLARYGWKLLDREEFATMFYGIIDIEANCLLYASAAAPSALVFSAAEKK